MSRTELVALAVVYLVALVLILLWNRAAHRKPSPRRVDMAHPAHSPSRRGEVPETRNEPDVTGPAAVS